MIDDNRAQQLLTKFGLSHLNNHYGMDGEAQNWSQILSIGEQQRLMLITALLVDENIIHLFILDETTSACDRQTQETIYQHLQQSGVQFLSVSHRPELEQFHSRKMTMDPHRCSYVIT